MSSQTRSRYCLGIALFFLVGCLAAVLTVLGLQGDLLDAFQTDGLKLGQWFSGTTNSSFSGSETTNAMFSRAEIEEMKKRLAPRLLRFDPQPRNSTEQSLSARQFLHLHHMKTGGTSMDGLMRCSMSRLREIHPNLKIPYTNIHECSVRFYEQCRSGNSSSCRDRVRKSAFMSYCAPLKDLPLFNWTSNATTAVETSPTRTSTSEILSLTVLRHPIARVWSMFRFQTKRCYKCRTLREVYETIDSGNASEFQGSTSSCVVQLMNHQTRNLLNLDMDEFEGNEEDLVRRAIANMKSFFTMIGLTEELNVTAEIVGHVFPWMAEVAPGSSNHTCPLPHANASPRNNRCINGTEHWDLPNIPDEDTAKLIVAHNRLDMMVYEAAVERFHLQKVALGF